MEEVNIGVIIHNRRIELGLSLEKVGNACGVNRSTIMRWEKGVASDIKRQHIFILSQVLYLPIETLLGIKDVEIESAELVLKKQEIIKTINSIKDVSKLDNIEKFIRTFVLWEKAFTKTKVENGIYIQR